uniref:Uncharacterized protein n=1 Tax=Rhizophora mucronata TaxID=61149 RepID=A0A2P2Q348_RHIMU
MCPRKLSETMMGGNSYVFSSCHRCNTRSTITVCCMFSMPQPINTRHKETV